MEQFEGAGEIYTKCKLEDNGSLLQKETHATLRDMAAGMADIFLGVFAAALSEIQRIYEAGCRSEFPTDVDFLQISS